MSIKYQTLKVVWSMVLWSDVHRRYVWELWSRLVSDDIVYKVSC